MAEDPKHEAIKNPRTPRELLMENFFVPFILTSLKELKGEELKFLVSPELEALVLSFKLPKSN